MEKRAGTYLEAGVLSRLRGTRICLQAAADGSGHGMHRGLRSGFNNEFSGHRGYVPGDDTRHIDWRIYGKRERLVVREYGADTVFPVVLALDTSASMGYASGNGPGKLEYAKRLVAHLAFLFLGQHDHVGIAFLADGRCEFFPAEGGRGRIEFIIGRLEQAVASGQTQLAPAIARLVASLRRRTFCIFFSDFLDSRSHLEVINRFPAARLPGCMVRIFDPAELGFPFERPRRFRDPEGGAARLVEPLAARRGYLESLAEDRALLRRLCRSRGIGICEIDTSVPPAEALAGLIRVLEGGG